MDDLVERLLRIAPIETAIVREIQAIRNWMDKSFDVPEPLVSEAELVMREAAARITALEAEVERLTADKAGLVDGLKVALRAADLALFVIRKQGVMPNDSWEEGFNSDTAAARAALEQHGGSHDQ